MNSNKENFPQNSSYFEYSDHKSEESLNEEKTTIEQEFSWLQEALQSETFIR